MLLQPGHIAPVGGARRELRYAAGWRLDHRFGYPLLYHDGRTCGFNNAVRRVPDRELCIVVLTNRPGTHAGRIADDLLRLCLDIPRSPESDRAEIERRARLEFPWTESDIHRQIARSLPEVTLDEIRGWRDSGALLARRFDGEDRYFRRAASNLFRLDAAARKRREAIRSPDPTKASKADAKAFRLTDHLSEVIQSAADAGEVEVLPVTHRVRYQLTVPGDHPRCRPGSTIRVWLPYPQFYRQQKNVRLIAARPSPHRIASRSAPQRSIYFESTAGADAASYVFEATYSFVSYAYYPQLRRERAEPYDKTSPLYQKFTAERSPHIVFTDEVRQIVSEITAGDPHPLVKGKKIFDWVSRNVPWVGEMEYSVIPNLSAKGLRARCGDCGVQGMTFITLCRAAGIPARWQSGWQTTPGSENMHDWSEIYVLPWGWLPVDASFGLQDHPNPLVRDFYFGHQDAYRLIVNLDYGRTLEPATRALRSEPNDFQRGEVEVDGQNLYFGEWDWDFSVETSRP